MKKLVSNFVRRTANFGTIDEEYELYCECIKGESVGFTPAGGQSMLSKDAFLALPPQSVKLFEIKTLNCCIFMFVLNYRHYFMASWM